jgi:hypothetical protein
MWKELDQCPHSLSGDAEHQMGYCNKIVDFMMSLAEGEDSISAVKEKYHIFIQELQSLEDRKEYLRLKREYAELKASGVDYDSLQDMEARINGYKVWWSRLSESVVKGLGRIADREKKTKGDQAPRLTVQQLNVLMKDSAKKLIDLEVQGDVEEKEE